METPTGFCPAGVTGYHSARKAGPLGNRRARKSLDLIAVGAGLAFCSIAYGNIYLTYPIAAPGSVVEAYDNSGSPVNTRLVSNLNAPEGIAVSGSSLFVTDSNAGVIGEYTISGDTVNTAAVAGETQRSLRYCIIGDESLCRRQRRRHVAEYTTSGQTVNAALSHRITQRR